jgi:DNA-binding SARP family transcriptional activator
VLDFRLTLILAGAGYGKTTALTGLPDLVDPLFWYAVAEPDRDPSIFLINLISCFCQRDEAFGEDALRILEANSGTASPAILTPLLNALTSGLSGDAVLVIDDYHLVQDVPEIAALMRQFIDFMPSSLHVVISTRMMPDNLDLNRWRMRGELNIINYTDLAFTAEEVEALFNQVLAHPLTPEQARGLVDETEGWVIALQMIGQSLENGEGRSLQDTLANLPDSLEGLFEYLAPEVLAHLPYELTDFMVTTSVLRRLDAPACDALRGRTDSLSILRRLHESGLFVDALGEDAFRYQKLFRDFLLSILEQDPQRATGLHEKAAEYYLLSSRPEESVYHFLKAGEGPRAAETLERIGAGMVRSGRLESLTYWIGRLPEPLVAGHPLLHLLMGDVLRLRAEFDAALEHYLAAEGIFQQLGLRQGRSRAMRGQAQIYLDTIRPLKADALLEEALRLMDPQEDPEEVACLLDQLAENKLNFGHPAEAQSLHREALLLRKEPNPDDVYLEGRSLLRTGRLEEAKALLEAQAEKERRAGCIRPQRFHRETLVLLSLVYSMSGEAQKAEYYARAGIDTGVELQSDFVEAVGHMRLGHALQVIEMPPWDKSLREQAMRQYQRSMDQINPFKVARVSVEPLWGLCRAYGYSGDVGIAEQKGRQALEIAEMAGDEWIGHLVRINLGGSYALAGDLENAEDCLRQAAEGMSRVGDLYSWCAAMVWRAVNFGWCGDHARSMDTFAQALPVMKANGYEALFLRPSLLGLKDLQALIPLLLEARRRKIEPEFVHHLLHNLGVETYEAHPGYTIWVRTLGSPWTWRGDKPVSASVWQRQKARQLFQVLITFRGQWLWRDQIVDMLWPDLAPEAAERDFKVAFSALNHVLEPDRPRSTLPFFVIRNDNMYRLNPDAHIVVDADQFESYVNVEAGSVVELDSLQKALALYEDDYLPETLYEDWVVPERERLRYLYMMAAGRLARLYLDLGRWDEAIQVANQTLARDGCWEPGYRSLMSAYAKKGNLAQVKASYNRCSAMLEKELGVQPSEETTALLSQLAESRHQAVL